MTLDPRLAELLPRFLRDAKLLARLKAADEEYEQTKTTGPLVIEAHYQDGRAQKAKLRMDVTLKPAQA